MSGHDGRPGGWDPDRDGRASQPPEAPDRPVVASRASRHAKGREGFGARRARQRAAARAGEGRDGSRPARRGEQRTGARAQWQVRLPGRPTGKGGPAVRTSLGMVAVLVAAAVALGAVASALPSPKTPAGSPRGDPYSSRWVCPLLPKQSGKILITNVGAGPVEVRSTLTMAGPDGKATPAGPPRNLPLPPGGTKPFQISETVVTRPGLLQVEGLGGPIAVSAFGVPSCAPSPSDRWWLSEADSHVGSATRILVANPNPEDATVQIRLHTSGGDLPPEKWKSIVVPARSAVEKNLDEVGAPGLRMWVEVVALEGRVVVGGMVRKQATAAASADGERERLLVPGQSVARSTWWFTGGLAGSIGSAELLLANPRADRPLMVDARVLTPDGATALSGFEGLVVEAGKSAQKDVLLQTDKATPFALQVRSRSGAPFMAALLVKPAPGSFNSALRVDPGVDGQQRRWLLPQRPANLPAAEAKLVLANFTGTPVAARVVDLSGTPVNASYRVPAARLLVPSLARGRSQVLSAGAGQPAPVDRAQAAGASQALVVEAEQPGVLVATLWGDPAVANSVIGGLSTGPIVPTGSVAAP